MSRWFAEVWAGQQDPLGQVHSQHKAGTVTIPGDCGARGGGKGAPETCGQGEGLSHRSCGRWTQPWPDGHETHAMARRWGKCPASLSRFLSVPPETNPRKPEQRGVCEMQLVGTSLQGSELESEWIGEGVDPRRIDSVSQ